MDLAWKNLSSRAPAIRIWSAARSTLVARIRRERLRGGVVEMRDPNHSNETPASSVQHRKPLVCNDSRSWQDHPVNGGLAARGFAAVIVIASHAKAGSG